MCDTITYHPSMGGLFLEPPHTLRLVSLTATSNMWSDAMGLLPYKTNCGLRMRQESRERFSPHQRKPLDSDPVMHQGTCTTHVPWCMPVSPTRNGVENVPGNPGACATRNFTYLVRGPWMRRKQPMASKRMACPIKYAHYTFKYSLIMELYYVSSRIRQIK